MTDNTENTQAENTEIQRTSLYEKHLESGAKMVEFAGWEMPINYGSQVKEHNQVREDAGMFDVSHMVILDLRGEGVKLFLQYLLANDVARLKEPGKALYSGMLNHEGGVIDDLIVYYLSDGFYRMVINAATRENDLEWIVEQAQDFSLDIVERIDLSMIAVQGPNAREKVISVFAGEAAEKLSALKPFYSARLGETFFSRTGYTGEDGFEIMLLSASAPIFWNQLLKKGVKPIGLGARDTLRLEAGMNLYGADMDTTVSALASGLGWTISWLGDGEDEREFIGQFALEEENHLGVKEKLVGLILEGKGVLRGHQKVFTKKGEGVITSGSFSPTLGVSIALARIPADATGHCEVEIRGKKLPAKIVKPPFVRNGKALV